MTFKEKLTKEHPNRIGPDYDGGCEGCPHNYGYEQHRTNSDWCISHTCTECWNREMPGTEEKPHILDSGERRQFETGAVRDIQEGKGRCDLMPLRVLAYIWRTIDIDSTLKGVDKARVFEHIADFQDTGDARNLIFAINSFTGYLDWPTAFLEVAKHFEEGAKKYGENNWQKGLPAHCYIDSAVRHYLKWLRGDKDEPHDRAFVWNLMCCIWECDYSPRAKEIANLITPIESAPADMVRYGDCPAGLFEYNNEGVFVKTAILDGNSTHADTMIAIHVNSGATRCFDNDVLVRPIDSPFTDERCGDE